MYGTEFLFSVDIALVRLDRRRSHRLARLLERLLLVVLVLVISFGSVGALGDPRFSALFQRAVLVDVVPQEEGKDEYHVHVLCRLVSQHIPKLV